VREASVDRAPGLSVRLKLTLSYAGFLMLAGALLLAAAWLGDQHRQSFEFLDGAISATGALVPGNSNFLLRAFAPAAAIVLAFLLVFGLLGGWLLAGRMLAPLTRITDATRVAANGSLSHRIRLPGRRDEFRELADAFDIMLARLEANITEQQRFAANASHELRTPLAITQTLLDVARNDPDRDTSELDERLRAVNARAIDLTDALLVLSRADQRSFTREHVDLSLIAEEATETLLPLAEERGLTIETSGDTTPTIGSYPLLLQLTTNLVHNAIVHNLPERGTVWVTTSVHPKSVMLAVENSGEKLTPQSVATLAEPFLRGTKRIRTDHAGVGLGLAWGQVGVFSGSLRALRERVAAGNAKGVVAGKTCNQALFLRLPPVARTSMVRRGSTVRVRQRLCKSAARGAFSFDRVAPRPACGGCGA
jgi:two-component system sensor histidine kinase VanS